MNAVADGQPLGSAELSPGGSGGAASLPAPGSCRQAPHFGSKCPKTPAGCSTRAAAGAAGPRAARCAWLGSSKVLKTKRILNLGVSFFRKTHCLFIYLFIFKKKEVCVKVFGE